MQFTLFNRLIPLWVGVVLYLAVNPAALADTAVIPGPDQGVMSVAVPSGSQQGSLNAPQKLFPIPAGVGEAGAESARAVAIGGGHAMLGGGVTTSWVVAFRRVEGVWTEHSVLRPSDPSFGDEFGTAIAIDGDRALIGAPSANGGMPDSGAAYIFEFDGKVWRETAKLFAIDGAASDLFGDSVSLNGNRAVIGAPRHDSSRGAVYVFEFDGSEWQQTDKLQASDSAASEFGSSLSLSGDRLLVGAPLGDKAFVFDLISGAWVESAVIDPNLDGTSRFGTAVSLDSDLAIISAPWEFPLPSAYIYSFDGSGWTEVDTFHPPVSDATYGEAVAIRGDQAMVGAPLSNSGTEGRVYVYTRTGDTWVNSEILNQGGGPDSTGFGISIALGQNEALIGNSWSRFNGMDYYGSAHYHAFDGSNWVSEQILTVEPGSPESQFGRAVATDGNRLVVGAPFDDQQAESAGAAYVYDRVDSEWVLQQKLLAPDAMLFDQFGTSVSVDNDLVLIGAPFDQLGDVQSGSAYLFEYTGSSWSFIHKFSPTNGQSDDRFGSAVKILGDWIFIGSPYSDSMQTNSGTVYVYRRQGENWQEVAQLASADIESGDLFGYSIAADAGRLFVGAVGDDSTMNISAGAVYVFELTGQDWVEVEKLTALVPDQTHFFGVSIDVSGGRLAVGAENPDMLFFEIGSAYLFEFDGSAWQLVNEFLPVDGEEGDEFGRAVSIWNDTLLVGSPGDDDVGASSGSVYRYQFDGNDWMLHSKLTPADGFSGDAFGWSLAQLPRYFVIGAPGDDELAGDSGSVHVFDLEGLFMDGFE